MKKNTTAILAVLLVLAIVLAGVFFVQKGNLQTKLDEATANVTTLTSDVAQMKEEAAAAAEAAAKAAEEEAARAAQEAAEVAKAAEEEAAKAQEEAAKAAKVADAAAVEAEAAKAVAEAAATQAGGEVAQTVEAAAETTVQAVAAVEEKTEEVAAAVGEKTEEVAAAVGEKTEEVAAAVEAKTEEVVAAVEAKTEEVAAAVEAKTEEVAAVVDAKAEEVTAVATGEKVDITVFQLKVEIDPMIQAFAKLYNEKHPEVNVTVETLGGGADYGGALKAKLAADQMPTVFMFEGQGGYELWKDYIADMSQAEWVKDTDLAYYDADGKAVGFPIAMEGFGLGYNADILQKAGIDPATLTTFSATKAAIEKIAGMKEELGLDAVVSVGTSVSGGLWWVTSQHVFNAFYAGYEGYNDAANYSALRRGEVDQERLTAFGTYLKLLYDNADPNVLENGNYDAQVAAFASGKAAFITQGNWIDPNLEQLEAAFPMGYISHNFLEEESTGLYMAAPSWFAVNAQATDAQQKAAIDFLNYMALSEDGANYMVAEAGMVPAFKSVTLQPEGPLSKALVEAGVRGGNFNWYFGQNPDGFNQGTLGPIFELLAQGTVEDFVKDITAAFEAIAEK